VTPTHRGAALLGIGPRVTEPPAGMADLATSDRIEKRLDKADFVIVTTPETLSIGTAKA
jgi:hypothetical protein